MNTPRLLSNDDPCPCQSGKMFGECCVGEGRAAYNDDIPVISMPAPPPELNAIVTQERQRQARFGQVRPAVHANWQGKKWVVLQPFAGVVSFLTFVGYVVMHLDTRRQGAENRKHAAEQEELHRRHAANLETMRVENEKAVYELRTDLERQKELDVQLRAALAEHYANVSAACRAKLSLINAADRAKFPQTDFDRAEGWNKVKELVKELRKAHITMKNATHDLLYLPPEVIDEAAELSELLNDENAKATDVARVKKRICETIRRHAGLHTPESGNSKCGGRMRLLTTPLPPIGDAVPLRR